MLAAIIGGFVKRSPARTRRLVLGGAAALVLATAVPRGHTGVVTVAAAAQPTPPFAIEEATIDDLHRAIRDGRTTCEGVIRAYVERARAYNGVVHAAGHAKTARPIAARTGAVRAGAPLSFPARTPCRVSDILPRSRPIHRACRSSSAAWSRRRPIRRCSSSTAWSSASPNAGQVNALSTLNLRGERSVTCKATCDAPPGPAPLPSSCPAGLRGVPAAARRARARRGARRAVRPQSGSRRSMPMYCVAMSFKDVYDTKDMRTTGGADVTTRWTRRHADATIVARAAREGRHHLREGQPRRVQRRQRRPGRRRQASDARLTAPARAARGPAWPAIPTTPTRETGGSSSGSAVVGRRPTSSTCSICEETGGSCRQPAWRNGVVGARHDQGPDALRRRHRRRPVPRSRRHPLPHRQRRRARARRDEGPEARLLRSARHLHARCPRA